MWRTTRSKKNKQGCSGFGAAFLCVNPLRRTGEEIVIPADLDFLAESAFADACRPGNPRDTSVEEIKALYQKLL